MPIALRCAAGLWAGEVLKRRDNPLAVSFGWLSLRAKGPPPGGLFTSGDCIGTTVYIDGYNLYFSRLRGSPFKWLDVAALFRDAILTIRDSSANVVAVKFFTAPIKATYASHGADSESARKRYHRALMLRHPELVEVIHGFHILGPSSLPPYVPGQPPNKADLHLLNCRRMCLPGRNQSANRRIGRTAHEVAAQSVRLPISTT